MEALQNRRADVVDLSARRVQAERHFRADRPKVAEIWPGGEVKIWPIEPVAKPRQTRSDRWRKRPCVVRYHAFRDEVRARGVRVPEEGYHVVFVLPMPRSWSKKKRAEMRGKRHQQKPDKDNLEKGLLDAVFGDDAAVWDGRASKIWGDRGAIVIGEC